jgi:hypothetical protein
MTKLSIRRVHYFSALKFSLLLGVIVAALPAFLFSFTFARTVGWLRDWLESWGILELGFPLPTINLLALLNLTDLLATLQRLDDLGWLLILGMTASLIVMATIWVAVIALLATLLYNVVAAFTGGLAVTADSPAFEAAAPQKSGAAAAPVVAAPVGAAAPAAPLKREPLAWLVSAGNRQNRWPLGAGRTSLGSAAENDEIIRGLAPRHAEIHAEAGRFALYDRSGGQCSVNGRPVPQGAWLNAGDRLRLGTLEFVFELGAGH